MAHREIQWLKKSMQPQRQRNLFIPTDYDILPEEHIDLLTRSLSVALHLIPAEPGLVSPVLRHPDLNPGNIILSSGSSKVAGVINWQASVIFPFFMQAGYPEFCPHDSSKQQTLHIPSLPPEQKAWMTSAPKKRHKLL